MWYALAGWTKDDDSRDLLLLWPFDIIWQRLHRSTQCHRLCFRLRERRLLVQSNAVYHGDCNCCSLYCTLHLGSTTGQERFAQGDFLTVTWFLFHLIRTLVGVVKIHFALSPVWRTALNPNWTYIRVGKNYPSAESNMWHMFMSINSNWPETETWQIFDLYNERNAWKRHLSTKLLLPFRKSAILVPYGHNVG